MPIPFNDTTGGLYSPFVAIAIHQQRVLPRQLRAVVGVQTVGVFAVGRQRPHEVHALANHRLQAAAAALRIALRHVQPALQAVHAAARRHGCLRRATAAVSVRAYAERASSMSTRLAAVSSATAVIRRRHPRLSKRRPPAASEDG